MERYARLACRHGLRNVYSSGRLHALRPAATRPTPAALTSIATLGLLRHRGKRGRRRKQRPIAVITRCPTCSPALRCQAGQLQVNNNQLTHRNRSDRLVGRPSGRTQQPSRQHRRATSATSLRPRCLLRTIRQPPPAPSPPTHTPIHHPPSQYVLYQCLFHCEASCARTAAR